MTITTSDATPITADAPACLIKFDEPLPRPLGLFQEAVEASRG